MASVVGMVAAGTVMPGMVVTVMEVIAAVVLALTGDKGSSRYT